jgi:hypothetical protein
VRSCHRVDTLCFVCEIVGDGPTWSCGLQKHDIASSAHCGSLMAFAVPAVAQRMPIIFFVAKGAPDGCGAGCSQWIAADGWIDGDAERRLREFLNALSGRDLPPFFHSPGGVVGQARAIGRVLRERRMAVRVGQTMPDERRGAGAGDEFCRTLIRPTAEVPAQLRLAGANCHSACVYAFIGASDRQVPSGARLGVHSAVPSRQADEASSPEQLHADRRLYVIDMGVDPALVDAAARIPPDSLRILSHWDIEQFGIETRGSYEVGWMSYRNRAKRLFLINSTTQALGSDRKEYRIASVRLALARGLD